MNLRGRSVAVAILTGRVHFFFSRGGSQAIKSLFCVLFFFFINFYETQTPTKLTFIEGGREDWKGVHNSLSPLTGSISYR